MKDEELFNAWKSEQYKDQSTEEKMEFVEHLHTFPKYFEKTFLAGLKAGRPQWHDLREQIPTENKMYLVAIKGNGLAIAYFNGKHWETKYNLGDFGHCVETVIAWCEIPTFNKEYIMFETEVEEWANEMYPCDGQAQRYLIEGAEFGYNKANEWHYVKDGDLPKAYQKCYFIYSNSYGEDNKVIFSKYNINVLTGIYAFFIDEETGEETTDPCFYDDINDDEIGLEEVYAWKEIVLPELPKESE